MKQIHFEQGTNSGSAAVFDFDELKTKILTNHTSIINELQNTINQIVEDITADIVTDVKNSEKIIILLKDEFLFLDAGDIEQLKAVVKEILLRILL